MPLPPSLLTEPTRLVIVLVVIFVCMAVEARIAARNERVQRAFGGIEPPGDVYAWMRIAYPGAFLLMGAEAFWRWRMFTAVVRVEPVAQVVVQPLVVGVVIFALAKLLKWWAMASLGRFWTFRVIVVPGSSLVRSGPYRWLSHPNYVGVIGELIGAALMLDARRSGLLATLGFGYLIYRRLRVEQAALATFVRGRA